MAIEMGHRTTIDRLRALDQLRGLTTAQLEQVAGLAEHVQVDHGEVLAKEGRIGRERFLILSGTVAVTQEGRHVDTLGPGSFFGEVIATDPGPRPATLTALTEVDVLILGPREFAALFEIPGFRDAMPMAIGTSLSLTPESAREGGVPTMVVERLQGVPWFAECTEEQLAEIAGIVERLRIQEGEVILREGRVGRELYIIVEGTVVVTRAGRVVNDWGPGDYFGELAAIDAAPRSATVTATSDLDVLVVGPRELQEMMEIPGFRNALLVGMSRRIREADDKLASFAEEERGNPAGS
ncbi:MAG TPA: cyclic nucleotide-binding domain-containing protein [Acidimicrobiales bacterium]|nr:cyclic nucleotide-binding domain-containing protein [Acidimicrobiales bacterium]